MYKYAESETFEVLLFAYSVDGAPVQIVDLAQGEKIPLEILDALLDNTVIKWAYNAAFERTCLTSYLKTYLHPRSWRCTMVWAATLGLPLSLANAGSALGLDELKLKSGKDLIRFFCMPNKNGRNLPHQSLQKWEGFKAYNIRDVEVELSIQQRLKNYPVPDFVWDEYVQDQIINDRGIAVDMQLVDKAISLDTKSKLELITKMKSLTNIDNPNSVSQLKTWLADNGLTLESLSRKDVEIALQDAPEPIAEVLKLRQQLSRSSVKKYQAIERAVCSDGRVRGMFQFYGANRTGRWSGRLVQLQNLKRNSMSDLTAARELVKSGEPLDMLYDDIPDTLSQLIRTAFIPDRGVFTIADFSSIEARVLAYLAGEKWRLDAFERGEDIYCASASQMFGVLVDKHSPLRQKGKIAELALGYGGSVGALTAMGALDMGLEEHELKPLVDTWRSANKAITAFWWEVDRCVRQAVKERTATATHGIKFMYKSAMLFIELPSKRRLAYVKPRIGENRFGGECVTYMGQTPKWERIESYGPKFVENIVQAIARDILAFAMSQLGEYRICAHIHDEVIIEGADLDEICAVMRKSPHWLPGIKLDVDGYKCEFYRK